MKLKLLLLTLMLSYGITYAQNDTIKTLIFTEFAGSGEGHTYWELSNVGNFPIQMGDFKFARMNPYDPEPVYDIYKDVWDPKSNWYFLPEHILQPGEIYVISAAFDFGPAQYRKKVPGFEDQERPNRFDLYPITDLLLHFTEFKSTPADRDSVTISIPGSRGQGVIQNTLSSWRGRSGFYLEQHFPNGDSAVVDQVNCVFDLNGKNQDAGGYDVAGVSKATGTSIICRKGIVKQGNLNFRDARGVGEDDSEWMVVPKPGGNWRMTQWITGNHGNYNLDENTLESDVIDVDFKNKKLTVPWGIRRGDGILQNMVKKPGIAWEYMLNTNTEDSLTFSCRTGDKLKIYVVGNNLDVATFDIIVKEPTASVNIVVPVANMDPFGYWREANKNGILDWPRVSQNKSGVDTISGTWYGIPYATRVDSLLELLEKPANAVWEIVWVDGVARPDLKEGDKLKITAQNGAVKEYYINVRPFTASHNAYLSSITWPDIPEQYKGIFGWIGDTIPNFGAQVYNYKIQVPLDVEGIPALIAKTQDLNARVEVKRATNISGTIENRTISFIVTAEDDSVKNIYNIELVKEKDPSKLQPFMSDPFISEHIFADQWANFFTEIANPGNQPLDLSDYMVVSGWTSDPVAAIKTSSGLNDWNNRYMRYIPGYKWVNEAKWQVTPATLEQDLNVNSIVLPGDVFCLGAINNDGQTKHPNFLGKYWWVPDQLDVQFRNASGYLNPWGEATGSNTAAGSWGTNTFLFKILNDSIKLGLKPAIDPNDFQLIDAIGTLDLSGWVVGGWSYWAMTATMIRKPSIYSGNPIMGNSFGSNPDNSEWITFDRPYWQAKNVGYPQDILYDANDLGKHFMNTPTHYMSTVSSVVYKVSEGYSMKESIRGMLTGTTSSEFLNNIIKANEKQTLTIKNANGILSGDAQISMNDTLIVMSADSTNTTKYVLEVSNQGLSSNAVLTSIRYKVNIEKDPKSASATEEAGVGNITGFDYGTALRTILANITVPAGATMAIVDGQGAYIPLKKLNFDTAYIYVTVNNNIYLNVVAENGVTEINYQLMPTSSENDAFLLSDVYSVVQRDLLIQYVPRGTNSVTFLSNLIPSENATIKLVNKMGQERLDGVVADDDKVVVTSASKQVTRTYHIAKLADKTTPIVTYLAYILSPFYQVDQVEYKVIGVDGNELISAFLAKVSAAPGATAYVIDKNGNVKTTGDINGADMVKVISADGKINVFYTFGPLTSANVMQANEILLYPNPTNGEINVSGLKAGYRIQVYNSVGAAVNDINVQNSIERISLSSQPSGLYMIVIRNENIIVGRYKALKN